MPKKPDKRIEPAKQMYLDGMKLIDIAKQLDLPEGTVGRWKSTHKWDSERSDKNDIRSTNAEIRNICKSMASAENKAFEHALDQAYLSVSSGAFSLTNAVKTAVNDLAKNGKRWVDYPTGAHRRADSAIHNALWTGVNQTATRC